MKKWIAALLMLLLLIEMLPATALAVVVSGKPLTESELEAARALAGLNKGAGVYHNGMKLSASMNAKQVSGWLDEQLKGNLHSVRHVLSRAESALATLKEEDPQAYKALMAREGSDAIVARGNELQMAAEDLRQTLRFNMDRSDENQAIIEQMTNLLSSDQVYDYEKIRYSERIRQAGGQIEAIRQEVLDNSAAWLKQIDEFQSICDGTYNGGNKVDAAMSDWMSALFQTSDEPVTSKAKLTVTGSATRSSRLSPGYSVLSDETTTITVIDNTEIGVYTDISEGVHLAGMKVSARDASAGPEAPMQTATTNDGGWVKFDISKFNCDEHGYITMYIEVDASGVKGDGDKDKYQSFCIPKLRIQGGSKYIAYMKENDGKPYVYKASFNGYDFMYNEREFYYSPDNTLKFDIVIETRNQGADAPTLNYKDTDGNPVQAKPTSQDGNTYTFRNTWKSIISPNNDNITINFGSQSIDTVLKPIPSVFNKPTDLSDWVGSMLGEGGFGLSFTIPGIDVDADLDLEPEFLKGYLPKVKVDIDGTVLIAIGKIMKDINTDDKSWMAKSKEDVDESTEGIEMESFAEDKKVEEGTARDSYKQQKLNFMAKGGVTVGVFAMLVAKWDPDVKGNERHVVITGTAGVVVSFYIDLTYQTSIGPVPVYANLNIDLSVGVSLTVGMDFLLDGDGTAKDWSIIPGDFTLDIRLTISVELGVGVKGVASIWVKGAGYLDFTISIMTSAHKYPLKITGGASVKAGLTVLFISFSVEIWSGGPWTLYESNNAPYSLLEHYMPTKAKKNDDPTAAPKQLMGPQSYPDLTPTATEVFTGLENTLDQVKFASLGKSLYVFYIRDNRLRWFNIGDSGRTETSITDVLNSGKTLYPSIYDCDYMLGNVKDFDFDVYHGSGTMEGGDGVTPDDYIAVTVVCAGSFDANGYPLEVENNVCVYTLFLWQSSDGKLVCPMNADDSQLAFFRYAWLGGQSGVVDFIGGSPVIELASSKVTTTKASDGTVNFTFDNRIAVELTRTQKAYSTQTQLISSVYMAQLDTTTASDRKPDKGSLAVQNSQDAYSDADVASGAGDDYARIFHRTGPDQSWIAVSRSNNGTGDSGAVEFYDPSMNVATSGKKSVVLDTGNIDTFAQALIPMENDQYARALFYTDDVGTDGHRYRLKSLYVMPTDRKDGSGNLELSVSGTTYDIDMPSNAFKQEYIGGALNIYWLSSLVLTDANGNNYDAYRVMYAVYDPTANILSNASVCAEFRMPSDSLAVRELFLTQSGAGYLTASPEPDDLGQKDVSTERTPLNLFTFETKMSPVIDLKGQAFQDTLVCPCDTDDFTISVMNSGNMAATKLDLNLLLIEDGKQTVVGTMHCDCLHPENNYVQMGDTMTVSGEKAFYRLFDFDYTPQRRDWVIGEANKKYIIQDGKLTDTQDGGGQFDYITTNVMLPGALAAFKSSMKVPKDWKYDKELEIAISGYSTNTNWVGAMASANGRNTISASRFSPLANAGTELSYVRDPKTGKMVLMSPSVESGTRIARVIREPKDVTADSVHDLHVHHRVFRGSDGHKRLSITITDKAQTSEPIKLYAEVYLDDDTEPLRVALPYYEDAVSSGKTQTIEMRLDALVDPDSCQNARVVIHGVDIKESVLSNNEFTLHLNGSASPLVITRQPRDVVARVGEKVSFSVEAAGGTKPYTYQWQVWMGEKKGWKDIKGAVLPTLMVNDITKEMNGRKARCIVTDGRQTKVTSDAATLTVREGVDTGDHSSLSLYLAVALAALALMALLWRKLRKE